MNQRDTFLALLSGKPGRRLSARSLAEGVLQRFPDVWAEKVRARQSAAAGRTIVAQVAAELTAHRVALAWRYKGFAFDVTKTPIEFYYDPAFDPAGCDKTVPLRVLMRD